MIREYSHKARRRKKSLPAPFRLLGAATLLLCGFFLLGATPQKTEKSPMESNSLSAINSVEAVRAWPISERLGVSHVRGKYGFGDPDFLNEGASRVLALGSGVIKVFMMRDIENIYPSKTPWPKHRSLVELASTPQFRKLFSQPFKTIILEVFALGRDDAYWRNGVTPAQRADETRQMENLTRYLLTTYRGSGKTFVLQNWEGDWAARAHTDIARPPTPQALRGMVEWLNARQDGVERAREEIGMNGVRVLHAVEVNLVAEAMDGKPSVTNDVLPHTRCDLVSYSAYETAIEGTRFVAALDYLAAKMPDSKLCGARNVYIGEFGVPENDYGTEYASASIRRTVREALDWGCPYVVYWQIFDNECKDGKSDAKGDCRGFWLIKPSGEKSVLWNVMREFLEKK